MGKKQELLFSKVKEACHELVMSSPVRPVEDVLQAVFAVPQQTGEQMAHFGYAEAHAARESFFLLCRAAPPTRRGPAWPG